MNKGLNNGLNSGVLSGNGKASIKSGLHNGLSNGNTPIGKDKMQDPANLTGEKLPWVYINADWGIHESLYTTIPDMIDLPNKWNKYNGMSTANHPYLLNQAITGTRIIDNTSVSLTATTIAVGTNASGSGNRPYLKKGLGMGDHCYLDFGGVNSNDTNNWMSTISGPGAANYIKMDQAKHSGVATDSMTVMIVMRSKGTDNKIHFYMDGSTTPGGIEVSNSTSEKIETDWFGYQADSIKSSKYESCPMANETVNDWFLYTGMFTLKDYKDGIGNEQMVYINGKWAHSLVSNNWVVPEPTIVFPTNQAWALGTNNPESPSSNGMYLAAFLLLPYWANDSEVKRLENYFRWYYNKRF